MLESHAITRLMAYPFPGNFRVYDPVYASLGNMSNFSSIEQVSYFP
jgi:hypothetical protein